MDFDDIADACCNIVRTKSLAWWQMQRFLKWLESKFSRHSSDVEADDHHTPVAVATKNIVSEQNGDYDQSDTVPELTTLEDPSIEVTESTDFEIIESSGFDPYNSGSFETSKSRSRK